MWSSKAKRNGGKKKKNSKYMHIPIDLEEQSRRKPCSADTYLFRTEIREVQPLSLVRHVSGCRNNRHDEHTYEMPYIYDANLCVLCAKGWHDYYYVIVNYFCSDSKFVELKFIDEII